MKRVHLAPVAGALALAALSLFALPACAERVQFDPTYNHVVCDSGCGSPVIFTPTAGATANLAVTTTSSDVALPAGSTVIITNAGAGDAAFRVQTGAGTAVTTDMVLKAGAAVAIAPPSGGHISAITASGSTSLNMQGGVGGATGYGVGPGGGGGGAVTVADGADVSLGAKADGAAASDTATASLVALIKRLNQSITILNGKLDTLNTTAGSPLAAGANVAGKFGVDQTTPGATNAVQAIAGSTGGATPSSAIVANNTTSVAICASACTLYGVTVFNNSGTPAYLKLYNAVQGSTTCGSGTPVQRILIPANTSGAGAVIEFGAVGVAYGTALTRCVTTGIADNDTGAPAATTYIVGAIYK